MTHRFEMMSRRMLATLLIILVIGDHVTSFMFVGRQNPRGNRWTVQPLESQKLDSAMSTQPADLTPAIDKFLSLPPSHTSTPTLPYFMTARGPAPAGPDPFALVADELQPLSDYVLELVKSENPVLTMAASHFFDQVRLSSGVCIGAAFSPPV